MKDLERLFSLLGRQGHDAKFDASSSLEAIAHATEKEHLHFSQHPLGFLISELPVPPDGTRRRVHVWPSDYLARSDQHGSIHTHTWELTSAVVAGRVKNLQFGVQEGGDYDVAKVEYMSTDKTELRPVSRCVSPILFRETETGPGFAYTERAGDYHSTELVQAPAVTAVLSVPILEEAYVLVPKGTQWRPNPLTRATVPATEALELLHAAAEQLQA
jgi:hypothetical protein